MPTDEEKLILLFEKVKNFKRGKILDSASPEDAAAIALRIFQQVDVNKQ